MQRFQREVHPVTANEWREYLHVRATINARAASMLLKRDIAAADSGDATLSSRSTMNSTLTLTQ